MPNSQRMKPSSYGVVSVSSFASVTACCALTFIFFCLCFGLCQVCLRPLHSEGLWMTNASHCPPVTFPHQFHSRLFHVTFLCTSEGCLVNHDGFSIRLDFVFFSFEQLLDLADLGLGDCDGFYSNNFFPISLTCTCDAIIFSSCSVGAFHIPLSRSSSYLSHVQSIN